MSSQTVRYGKVRLRVFMASQVVWLSDPSRRNYIFRAGIRKVGS